MSVIWNELTSLQKKGFFWGAQNEYDERFKLLDQPLIQTSNSICRNINDMINIDCLSSTILITFNHACAHGRFVNTKQALNNIVLEFDVSNTSITRVNDIFSGIFFTIGGTRIDIIRDGDADGDIEKLFLFNNHLCGRFNLNYYSEQIKVLLNVLPIEMVFEIFKHLVFDAVDLYDIVNVLSKESNNIYYDEYIRKNDKITFSLPFQYFKENYMLPLLYHDQAITLELKKDIKLIKKENINVYAKVSNVLNDFPLDTNIPFKKFTNISFGGWNIQKGINEQTLGINHIVDCILFDIDDIHDIENVKIYSKSPNVIIYNSTIPFNRMVSFDPLNVSRCDCFIEIIKKSDKKNNIHSIILLRENYLRVQREMGGVCFAG
jgi:hypothetical protein